MTVIEAAPRRGRRATPVRTHWFGVGQSAEPHPRDAGADATLQAIRGGDLRLLIVFASPAQDLPELLRGIRDICPDVPLIGCSTAGEIASDGPGTAGVVVTALGGEGFSVATSVARNASRDLRAAGEQAALCAERVAPRRHQLLLLLTDGLGGNQQEIVRGAYGVVGASMPLVGGCAGDDMAMKRTRQFHGGELLEDAVVAAAISCESPFGIGVQHGWRRVGKPMLVSESKGNRVLSLDDRPALDAYLERLDPPCEARTDPAAFAKFAMTHPLGVSRRSGEEVRLVADADFTDRSLGCIAELPQGGLAWLMEGDEESVLSATDAACAQALEGLGDRTPIGVVAFDCIARRGVLGEQQIDAEVRRIATQASGAPVAGFYTYGEIARTSGVGGFHNQTLVVLAFS